MKSRGEVVRMSLIKKWRVLNRNGEDVTQGFTNGDGGTTALLKRNGLEL